MESIEKKINPGAKWNDYYSNNNLVWENKNYYNEEYINSYLKSEWIKKLITNLEKGDAILEAGCGTGLYSITLAYLGYNVTSIDYNSEAIELAKNNLKLFNSQSSKKININFLQGDLLNLKFSDDSFDLVFNQAVLEYFTDDDSFRKAIFEMRRVTKKGGNTIAIIQNTNNPLRFVSKFFDQDGFVNQPDVRKINTEVLKYYFGTYFTKIKIDGLFPWKSVFKVFPKFGGKIYYLNRFFEKFIPLPRFIRSKIGIQLIVSSIK